MSDIFGGVITFDSRRRLNVLGVSFVEAFIAKGFGET